MEVKLIDYCAPDISDERLFLKHSFFSFYIEGISRACSHQLVRHRLASYSQQSQRYVELEGFKYVTPETLKGSVRQKYQNLMSEIADFYGFLVRNGVPKEDARFVLPNACTTRLVMTMSGRELFHFFKLRTCNRAQWEIRELAIKMLELLRKKWKIFFKAGPSCYRLGYCPEGSKTCGNMEQVRAFFEKLGGE